MIVYSSAKSCVRSSAAVAIACSGLCGRTPQLIIDAAAAYRTASGTFVTFETKGSGVGCSGRSGNLVAQQIGAAAPSTIDVAWCGQRRERLADCDYDRRELGASCLGCRL